MAPINIAMPKIADMIVQNRSVQVRLLLATGKSSMEEIYSPVLYTRICISSYITINFFY